jgi:alkylation response protein AidB-like acyl-CoA dehydrogenase
MGAGLHHGAGGRFDGPERARERRQFGRAIGDFQFVAGRLADMRLRVETSRALLYAFARRKADGRSAMAESAMAKLHIGEAWIRSCEDAMQIFGGSGYLKSTGLERELRDALGSRAYSGTPDIQRAIVARMGPADPP